MSKFVLVDHSLMRFGGHHFDYAEHALWAAADAGYQISVAGHKSFRKPASWGPQWESHSIFPFTLYDQLASHGTDNGDLQSERESNFNSIRARFSWLSNWRTRLERRITLRQALDFARGLQQLLDRVSLDNGDQVFFPTISIFDFHCLAEFLHDLSETQRATWHLQFHYGPAVASGPAADRLRDSFTRAWQRMSKHQVRLYATTSGLAQQICSLGARNCEELPHHVHARFTPELLRNPSDPLRVLCAGCPRHEKGYQHLSQIVLDLWSDYFGTGKAQLCLQAKQSFLLPNRPRHRAGWNLGEHSVPTRFHSFGESSSPISYIRFPLPVEEYVRMIRTADIGLFVYDPAAYRHRCSGVFVEMLSAGVPVIVPSNCWMAEQVQLANSRCHERTSAGTGRLGMVGLVAQNANDTPALIREMLDNYSHYRTQALAHSASWRQSHIAQATMRRLIGSSQQACKLSAA